MNQIKLLDCTLRDGGYINDWKFSNKHISKIVHSLEESKVEIIECGYLNDKKGSSFDSTMFESIQVVDKILNDFSNKNSEKVVMINFGDCEIEKLPPKKQTSINGIRLAFHKKDIAKVFDIAYEIKKLGYKLFLQPMITKNYFDIEFLEMIEKVNILKPYAFYIVDSFGSMTLDEFHKYLILADSNLKSEIILGYHSHNNMQLAFSNAVSMCNINLKHDLIIDASIYGIGRGAGNLNTELIADFLNKYYEKDYDTLPLLEMIDEFLNSLMKQNPWGFAPAQFLSAVYNCHPNYATYLINKNTNHIVGVKKILDKLPKEYKVSFNKEIVEQLYIDSILEEKTPLKKDFEILKHKKIILLASGRSVSEYKGIIEQAIDENSVVIGLNHIPNIKSDYYFFTNQKRYDEFVVQLDPKRIVITNNIKAKYNHLGVLDFKKLTFVDEKLVVNVATACINYLIYNNISEVYIAGLDGYQINTDNYNYLETAYISDSASLEEQNEVLSQALGFIKTKIDTHFLTPTLLLKKQKLKIVGVIPARYKSSRFEGKPLCIISGETMIKRTYIQANKSELLDDLVVATENEKIKQYCESENIPVVMTSDKCLTGTDRIAEVSKSIQADLYVNIQGDEPIIDPKSIDEVVNEYKKYTDEYIAYNLYKFIDDDTEVNTDTIIKTITNEKDELMYMSRLGVPFNKSKNIPKYKKQVCIYGFTKKALDVFSSREKTINEQYEDIEILRFVDMGYKVKMNETQVDSIAVDIPDDIEKVEIFLKQKGLK